MVLPFFYKEDLDASVTDVVLDEDASKHIVQVLRMQNGEQLQLTNGKGNTFTCKITGNNRKRCAVTIQASNFKPQTSNVSIAISLIKNSSRFEWFLEKATELGVSEIIPLVCERTEKTAFKTERMKSILVSAMLQSQQCWLPVLHEPKKIQQVITSSKHQQKFIAHCIETEKRELAEMINGSLPSKIILIGPEGDFTSSEVELALQDHFIAVSLGDTRLRTETAGIASAVLLRSCE
jgi:16S rRNA (uracil1498-N3)-methyltransferase